MPIGDDDDGIDGGWGEARKGLWARRMGNDTPRILFIVVDMCVYDMQNVHMNWSSFC